jgi:hypothetical protein
MALQLFGTFFSLLIYTQSVGVLGRWISPSQGRYLHNEQHKQNKCTHISMRRVGFEPTIPVFERAKTVHVLDRAATVISHKSIYNRKIYFDHDFEKQYAVLRKYSFNGITQMDLAYILY